MPTTDIIEEQRSPAFVLGQIGNALSDRSIAVHGRPDVAELRGLVDELAAALGLQANHWPTGDFHTSRDHRELVAVGVDPTTVQPRDQGTACRVCRAETWHVAACCDAHYEPPAAVSRAVFNAGHLYLIKIDRVGALDNAGEIEFAARTIDDACQEIRHCVYRNWGSRHVTVRMHDDGTWTLHDDAGGGGGTWSRTAIDPAEVA
jgi:hypothetical protein